MLSTLVSPVEGMWTPSSEYIKTNPNMTLMMMACGAGHGALESDFDFLAHADEPAVDDLEPTLSFEAPLSDTDIFGRLELCGVDYLPDGSSSSTISDNLSEDTLLGPIGWGPPFCTPPDVRDIMWNGKETPPRSQKCVVEPAFPYVDKLDFSRTEVVVPNLVAPDTPATSYPVRTANPRPVTAVKSEQSLLKSNNRSVLLTSAAQTLNANVHSAPQHVKVKVEPTVDEESPCTPPPQSGDEGDSAESLQASMTLSYVVGEYMLDEIDGDNEPVPDIGEFGLHNEGGFVYVSTGSRNGGDDMDTFDTVRVSEVTGVICPDSPPAPVKTESRNTLIANAVHSDHSYHLSKGAVKTDNLGVQTPSDSEEEIDVVSLGEKHTRHETAAGLPTNPTPRLQQLQRTVASAISAKHPPQYTFSDEDGDPEENQLLRSVTQKSTGRRGRNSSRAAPYQVPTAAIPEIQASATGTRGRVRVSQAGRIITSVVQLDDLPDPPEPRARRRTQTRTKRARNSTRAGGRGRRARGSDSEPDPMERRSQHNNMERQRRIDLRNLVDELREIVPAVKENRRAAKVTILREAAKYCTSLREDLQSKVQELDSLRQEQDTLVAQLSVLRQRMHRKRQVLQKSEESRRLYKQRMKLKLVKKEQQYAQPIQIKEEMAYVYAYEYAQ